MKVPGVSITDRWRNIESYAPWLILAVFLTATYLFWQDAHRAAIQKLRAEFDAQAIDSGNRIRQRIAYNEQVLHGVRAFYLNQQVMEHHGFAGYIASLEIEKNFPKIQGISFAPLVSDANKSSHIDSMHRSDLPDYAIKPEGRRSSYAPIAYIEPFNDRNARVLGFDNLSDPVRKATIELARDEDRAVISEKLILKQENERALQAGFLMFLPVYQRGAAHDTLAARRANTDGWFAASFLMSDLIADALDGRSNGIGIAVFDGEEISGQNRIHISPKGVSQRTSPLFATTVRINVPGRTWSMQLFSLPEFEAKRDKSAEHETLVWGGALSLLLSLFTWLLVRHQRRVTSMTSAIGREFDMRKQAEHKSHNLSLFNEVILRKSPAGIAVYMESGPCIMANEAYSKAIGGTVEELLNQDFRNSPSWQRNGLLDFASQALDTGLTIRRDVEGVTSFGRAVVLECIFSRIDISGESRLLVITNDVSVRAKAERALSDSMHQLEKKELSKTRFLAAAGHDLRQPLTAANMFIYSLKSTALSPRQNEIIQRLDRSMSTFGGLLDALLNVSKLDAGSIKPEYTSINVPELIIWLEENFAPVAGEKQLDFKLYFSMKETLFVRSDIGLLKSVLMNLVSNAIKFTSSGAILVVARRRGDDVLFQVWDTGIGIVGEQIDHIYDEFYQIGNPQRDRTSGLGLGLSIVKRTLTLLGGEIRCRSQIARGTVFEFRLASADLSSVIPPQGATVTSPQNMVDNLFAIGKKFIVVEDDMLVAQATTACLEEMGGSVKCFHSAEDALLHADIEGADYYIVDYMLGGALNGIQFLNLLRQQSGKHINAVLVTGDTSSNFIGHAADFDWPVLFKPVNVSELFASLSSRQQDHLTA